MVLVALTMSVLVLMAAFAVDLGMQRVARRDMQALSDVVATDLSRELKSQSTSTILTGSAFPAALVASVGRNDDHVLGDRPVVLVEVGSLVGTSFTPSGSISYTAGAAATTPAVVGSAVTPNAVRVTASNGVDFAFTTGRGDVARSALSTTQSYVCFRVGSYAISVDPNLATDPESKLLNSLLADALDVTAIGYHGLADARVSLGGLAAALNVGSPDQLMAVKSLSIRRLLSLSADVLAQEMPGATADVTLLRSLAAKSSTVLDTKLDLDKIFNLTTGSTSALATTINVLDLVAGAAFVANGDTALKSGVVWNEPALSHGEIELRIIESPRPACGPVGSKVSTAQVKLNTVIELAPGQKVAGLTVVSATNRVPLMLGVDIAKADAELTRIKCGAGTSSDTEEVDVRVSRNSAVMGLDAPIRLQGTVSTDGLVKDLGSLLTRLGLGSLLGLLNPPKFELKMDLTVQAGAGTSTGATTSTAPFVHPPTAYGEVIPVLPRVEMSLPTASIDATDVSGSVRLLVDGTDKGAVAMTELNLTSLTNAITSEIVVKSINPLIGNINSVLAPVTSMLGMTATGADVIVQSAPSCDVPKLVG